MISERSGHISVISLNRLTFLFIKFYPKVPALAERKIALRTVGRGTLRQVTITIHTFQEAIDAEKDIRA